MQPAAGQRQIAPERAEQPGARIRVKRLHLIGTQLLVGALADAPGTLPGDVHQHRNHTRVDRLIDERWLRRAEPSDGRRDLRRLLRACERHRQPGEVVQRRLIEGWPVRLRVVPHDGQAQRLLDAVVEQRLKARDRPTQPFRLKLLTSPSFRLDPFRLELVPRLDQPPFIQPPQPFPIMLFRRSASSEGDILPECCPSACIWIQDRLQTRDHDLFV